MGLPGDNPDNFKRTVEKARRLPVAVRVFHCLVLPNALMTRAPASFDLKYDPFTLEVISCQGWTRQDIEATRRWLDDLATHESDATRNQATWKFARPGIEGAPLPGREAAEIRSATGDESTDPSAALPASMCKAIERVLAGMVPWRLRTVVAVDGQAKNGLVLYLDGAPGVAEVRVTPAKRGEPSFRSLEGVAYSYGKRDFEPTADTLRDLDRAIGRLHPVMKALLLGMSHGTKPARGLAVVD
jgi:hypothetical protein